ncbi:hypothetical protein LTR91_024866 [Friedmanniomyces endolithicus]|uniref:F-box domain-containing protein n=2 Tax=Dothideomycetidae TaxID=451867 RepID=A0AAN6H699_9PEZI|nr:hypothetical protein LTR94_011179 [Friedmanniomyces endolithicus]KAK0797947.1 hypothetical protein LTR59_006612 [Friedmanniomyces endolithicus]KAK0806915.1 hypothetical protein LTR38_005067 [Friedmanniomyces endolithicus]KAK0821616.1 hypothetical protein LTR75_000702 [Friedmanniomyces endolithicus]KAK0857067.1 hypothetical protein LTR03_000988 [Friedmanniomyces endolithicus]
MLSVLDLPRELYLIVCTHLQPTDLARLAGVSRDHYLAAQEPLYTSITITSYSRFVKLVDTLRRVPVVSTISPQQRLRWFKLTDAQLREREIKHLHIILDNREDGYRITGATLSNCIGAVARKCYSVKIHLSLYGAWPKWIPQLERFGLPNVTKLTLFLGGAELEPGRTWRGSDESPLWNLVFSGSSFSDLKDVYINTRAYHPGDLPSSLRESIHGAHPVRDYVWTKPHESTSDNVVPFYGLRRMERIVLAHTPHLTLDIMQSLFGSDIIPQNLTKLEIVNCASLHPVKHLPAIATLLQRALQLVKHLKLHLCKLSHFDNDDDHSDLATQYASHIDQHSAEHPCNIVRELGNRIPYLDLALPFACAKIFPPAQKSWQALAASRDYPAFPREPVETLPARLMAQGYKYRRLISWHGVCRGTHKWHDMRETAANMQQERVSWVLVSPNQADTWQMPGCLAVERLANEELLRGFTEEERWA